MFKIKDEAERATVYIYGVIGDSWDEDEANRAKAFAQTLDQLSPKPLDIRIDSPGGDVYEGFAIASAIQRYAGDTHAYVDGMAASAASYVALMADRVTMNDFSMFMIHNAWGLCIGNRDELRDMADRLEYIDGTIAEAISKRSAMTLDEVTEAMGAETWYKGEDALAVGLCDEVIVTEQRVAACLGREIAERYRNIPEDVTVVDAHEEGANEFSGPYELTVTADRVTVRQGLNAIASFGGAWHVEAPETEPEGGASHALPTISDNEVKDAEGAILLGNRVYRKEI